GDRGLAADAAAATDDRGGRGARGRDRGRVRVVPGNPGVRRDRLAVGAVRSSRGRGVSRGGRGARSGRPRPVPAGLGPGGGDLLSRTRPADAVDTARGRRRRRGGSGAVRAGEPAVTIASDRRRSGGGRRRVGSARVVVGGARGTPPGPVPWD